MVEIFKTDVNKKEQANILLMLLSRDYPAFSMNFDLHDCDNILRVEGNDINPNKIIQLLRSKGHECEVLF